MELWYTEEWTKETRFSMKVREHLFTGKSDFQKIDVIDTYEFGKVLLLDGLVMVTEKDEFVYHDMIVHPAMATNPRIKNVLVIGAGDGGTVRELTRYKSIEKIDMVEIDKMVVDISIEYLPITSSKLKDPRVNLYYEDGIKFIKGIENKYDLIIVDSTDPIGPGEGLFTYEFYNNVYKALTDEGILINQNESAYFERDAKEMLRANKKISEIFPIAKLYMYCATSYPSGNWYFGFGSKKYDPIKDFDKEKWLQNSLDTKYYNTDIHLGAFAIPSYVKKLLETGEYQLKV